jgi:predicted DNA-binding antitoxin AbrB/MazE fold protein
MSIHASNDIVANGSFVATSDKRVKENITELSNSIDLLGRLRPVSYNKIDKVQYGDRLNYGFIAQEVEEIIPEAVNTGKGEVPVLKPFENVTFEEGVDYTILVKNGEDIKELKFKKGDVRPDGEIIVKSKTVNDFKSITYDMIFTVAVDAIQEQQQEIENLKAEMKELKSLLNQLAGR